MVETIYFEVHFVKLNESAQENLCSMHLLNLRKKISYLFYIPKWASTIYEWILKFSFTHLYTLFGGSVFLGEIFLLEMWKTIPNEIGCLCEELKSFFFSINTPLVLLIGWNLTQVRNLLVQILLNAFQPWTNDTKWAVIVVMSQWSVGIGVS